MTGIGLVKTNKNQRSVEVGGGVGRCYLQPDIEFVSKPIFDGKPFDLFKDVAAYHYRRCMDKTLGILF